jgi:hypothetical protein
LHPRGEVLALVGVLEPRSDQGLDELRELVGPSPSPTDLLAEGGVFAEVSAGLNEERFDPLAVGPTHERSLDADVGELEADARVWAAVEVDADSAGHARQSVLPGVGRALAETASRSGVIPSPS